MSNPLISILTPCYNRADFIGEAVESVLAQGYDNFEHIVIDGASTDGTLDVLAGYPHLTVISEPDDGMWDALNKGLARAKGEIIGHLNSDDLYLPGCFAAVVKGFAENPQADSVCGGCDMFRVNPDGGREVLYRYNNDAVKSLRLKDITRYVPITNSRFFKRRVYDQVGGYSQKYPYGSDREFFLRVFLAGVKTAPIPGLNYSYRYHEGSFTMNDEGGGLDTTTPDYLAIADEYLAKPGLPGFVKRELTRWKSWERGWAASRLFLAGRYGESLKMMLAAWREDPLWPLVFPSMAIKRRLERKSRGHDAA